MDHDTSLLLGLDHLVVERVERESDRCRVIKLEARNAYGFRNPTNQRLHSRCATTRSARRQIKPG